MSILNVNQIQPVGSGQTITISASDITASSATITASSVTATTVTSSSTSTFSSGLNVTGGSVGIGTDNPARNLVVNGGSSEGVVQITNNTSGTSVANGFELIHFTNGETQLLNRENGAMRFDTNGTERLRISSSGNVGIGTDNPTTEFEVLGGGTVASFRGTGGGSFIMIKDEDDGTLGFIGVDGGSIKFQTSGGSYSDKLVIDTAGHVTKPNQPCFAAWRTTTQTYTVNDNVVFNSERFDNNSDYNTTTGEFTAPVTGRYLMLATALVQQADVGDQFDIRLYTSNQTYYGAPGRLEVQLGTSWTNGSGNNYIALGVQHIVDMDANDVASIRFTTFEGGSIYGTSSGDWTRFAGYLLC